GDLQARQRVAAARLLDMDLLSIDLERDPAAGMRGSARQQQRGGGEIKALHGSLPRNVWISSPSLGASFAAFRDIGHNDRAGGDRCRRRDSPHSQDQSSVLSSLGTAGEAPMKRLSSKRLGSKRLGFLAMLMVLSSSAATTAQAGYTFVIGGHRIHI